MEKQQMNVSAKFTNTKEFLLGIGHFSWYVLLWVYFVTTQECDMDWMASFCQFIYYYFVLILMLCRLNMIYINSPTRALPHYIITLGGCVPHENQHRRRRRKWLYCSRRRRLKIQGEEGGRELGQQQLRE